MRIGKHIEALEGLATAKSLCTPFLGFYVPSDDAATVYVDHGWDWGCHPVAIVEVNGGIVGFVTRNELFGAWISIAELESSEVSASTHKVIGDLCHPIEQDRMVSSNCRLSELLSCFANGNDHHVIVMEGAKPVGSIQFLDLLKPPAISYYLCLALDLEAAALDLCVLYPRSFYCLSPERRKAAVEVYKSRMPSRMQSINAFLEEGELRAHPHVVLREIIQATMMCDKRDMLCGDNDDCLGLKSSKGKIRRAFRFGEKIRNFIAHPTASFAHNPQIALDIESANHEQIAGDDELTTPHTVPIEEQLGLSAKDLAAGVTATKELIADIELHLLKRP